MTYKHGIRIQENPTSVPTPVKNETGVPVVFGTAPVNLAADPEGAVNKLILCNTFAEAKVALGYSKDYKNYTLCQAMDAFFKVFGVGPVVFCNVLDMAVHTEEYTETLDVVSGQALSTKTGVVQEGLKIASGDVEMEKDRDYTLSFNEEGYLTVSVITEDILSITLTGSMLAPSKVTVEDVIGSYDVETGRETGFELVRQVFPNFGLVPSLLLAPGWSHIKEAGLGLAGKCTDINGMFQCECVVDIDCSENGADKYTDVGTVKNENGFIDKHMICVWPKVKLEEREMYYSAMYAALACHTDHENGDVPNLSPSNHALGISAVVREDGKEVFLDVTQGNVLNGEGVVTALNFGGFRAWGNNTAAYPGNSDPKDRWIPCRRFFSWWGNSFITTYMSKVDSPINYRLIESIVDSENMRGNSFVSQGKCAGIRIVYNREDNPLDNVMEGKIVFRQYLAPYTPAEDILNILEFDPSMIEAALGGD